MKISYYLCIVALFLVPTFSTAQEKCNQLKSVEQWNTQAESFKWSKSKEKVLFKEICIMQRQTRADEALIEVSLHTGDKKTVAYIVISFMTHVSHLPLEKRASGLMEKTS